MLFPPLKHSPQTSPSLLLRLCNVNDHESWQLFFNAYSPVLRDYFVRKKLQPADADDLVQEVLTAVVKAMRNEMYDRTKGRFRSWLGTVAANRLANFFRDRSADADFVPLVEMAATHYHDPDNDWVDLFSLHLFRLACERIREEFESNTWESFRLTWIEQRAASDVSIQLQIPIHSVYVNKSRVIHRLRREIESLAEDCAIAQ